jgi:hypothetical protein
VFHRIKKFLARYIDFRMAVAGAVVMGVIVFLVNYLNTSEVTGAATASLKQAAYTFLFGGFIMKTCERLAANIQKTYYALFLAIFIPSLLAISLTYIVHSLKGTPLPLESTIPTAILIIPASIWWAVRSRKRSAKRQALNA